MLLCNGEHTARSRRRVINRTNGSRGAKSLIITREDEVDKQADSVTRSKVLAGRLIRGFIKSADEVFVEVTHLSIGNLVRM